MKENPSSKCRFRDWYDNAAISKLPSKRIATGRNQELHEADGKVSGLLRSNFDYGADKMSTDDYIPLPNGYSKPVLKQLPTYVEPLVVFNPHDLSPEHTSSEGNCADGKEDDSNDGEFKSSALEDRVHGIPSSSHFDIASSANKDVKISLNCNSSGNPFFRNKTLNTVLREVEDEYRRTYNIQDPGFSLMKLMERICECFIESDSDSKNGPVAKKFDSLKKAGGKNLGAKDDIRAKSSSEPSHPNGILFYPDIVQGTKGDNMKMIKAEILEFPQSANLHSLKAVPQKKHPIYLKDISRGEEKLQIPLVNEYDALELPNFLYIKKNMAHKDAHIDFSLARISDDNFCAQCHGDCLSSALPCACAGETRGEFAYTDKGLLKEEFLDECIAMGCEPARKYLYYCEICPLQNDLSRKKSRRIKLCKGHLSKKFIKECWSKCGCSRKCGNRVVQQGIQVALQVFATPERKGWGVRSVNALKKGTFVCEYVGEIVTNQELYERNTERATRKEKHTYPLLLDADWGSERILKDEEALCLDATEFGNVGRFVNHRCHDPNLIEIPVEIETPDHHYYHLAFFTTKDIKPMEELTWDYGIAFDDKYHPIEAFKCKCGSTYCRDRT